MSENWEKVLVTASPYQAELAKAFLAEHEIEAVVINKKSSSYPPFGNCEVYVLQQQASAAKTLLDNETTFS